MEHSEKKSPASVDSLSADEDNHELIALGYKPSFKREFTNLPVVRLLVSSIFFKYLCKRFLDQFRIQHNGMSFPCQSDRKNYVDMYNCFQGVGPAIAMTFNTPLTLGGPTSVRTHIRISYRTSDDACFLAGRLCGVGFSGHVCASRLQLVLRR